MNTPARRTGSRRGAIVATTIVACWVLWMTPRNELYAHLGLLGMFLFVLLPIPIGIAASLWLDRGALRRILAAPNHWLWFAIAAALALADYGVVRSIMLAGSSAPPIHSMQLFFFSLALTGPISEEFLFRGVLLDACRRTMHPVLAFATSVTLFTAYHGPERLAEYPSLFLLGAMLTLLRLGSGSLQPGMVAHTLYNLMCGM